MSKLWKPCKGQIIIYKNIKSKIIYDVVPAVARYGILWR